MPRVLARMPYGAKTSPVEEFAFEEDTAGADHNKYVWTNAAYSMATNVTRSFKLYGWCARIRGAESGGMVEGLARPFLPDRRRRRGHEVPDRNRHHRPARKRTGRLRVHADFALEEHRFRRVRRRAIAAEAAGLRRSGCDGQRQSGGPLALPVRHLPVRPLPEVHGARQDRRLCQPGKSGGMAEQVDRPVSWTAIQRSTDEVKASFPLVEAQVVVEEDAENPGYYSSKFYLKPHYQLEGLTVSLRLVSKLPATRNDLTGSGGVSLLAFRSPSTTKTITRKGLAYGI